MPTLFTGSLGFADKAGEGTHRRTYLYWEQILAILSAKDITDALTQTTCLEIQHLRTIMMKGEMDLRIYKHNALKSR